MEEDRSRLRNPESLKPELLLEGGAGVGFEVVGVRVGRERGATGGAGARGVVLAERGGFAGRGGFVTMASQWGQRFFMAEHTERTHHRAWDAQQTLVQAVAASLPESR